MNESDCKQGSRLTVSIVSHGQADLVCLLLGDLKKFCAADDEVIVTLNIDELLEFDNRSFPCAVTVLRNTKPLGFGANHNKAFALAKGDYFCVLNPDIRLYGNPFPGLLSQMKAGTGIIAPKVVNSKGEMEESARRFPTPFTILKKAFQVDEKKRTQNTEFPDWVAGMFMVFPAHIFRELKGFDERYFLYYEDVDICSRLKLAGYGVQFCSEITVEHDAQCRSHSDPAYRTLHLQSMIRYFFSPSFVKLQLHRLGTRIKEKLLLSG